MNTHLREWDEQNEKVNTIWIAIIRNGRMGIQCNCRKDNC